MDRARILVVDDEVSITDAYARLLASEGHETDTARTEAEALEKVRDRGFDLVLTDLVMPGTDGVRILENVKRVRPSTLVVVFSGQAEMEDVLRTFRKGAFDFLLKPVGVEELSRLAERAIAVRRLGEKRQRVAEDLENERLRLMELRRRFGCEDPFRQILGGSSRMQELVELLREVARTDSTVLLTGESGTGKNLIARTIHEASGRCGGPFVEANCVVYSEGVLHSELFGHERGAFTGAAKLKRGRFELARGGTLLLDEIGEIAPSTQLMLLRVLQDRTFERVGGEETLEADVRLIAATSRDLQEAIGRGTFRSDLFYRLNVIPIHVPPLREHPEDVPLLAQSFLRMCGERLARDLEGFTPEAMEALTRYPWPGNVRELENLVEQVVVLSSTPRIDLRNLPPRVTEAAKAAVPVSSGKLLETERACLIEALEDSRGNKKLAASKLGIHRSTLYAKMRRHGLFEGETRAG